MEGVGRKKTHNIPTPTRKPARCGGDHQLDHAPQVPEVLRHDRKGQLADCREGRSWLGRRPRTLNGVGNHSRQGRCNSLDHPRLASMVLISQRRGTKVGRLLEFLGISWDCSASALNLSLLLFTAAVATTTTMHRPCRPPTVSRPAAYEVAENSMLHPLSGSMTLLISCSR